MKNVFEKLFLLGLLVSLGCNKDGLTKATQNGANTFSCKVNGKVFKSVYKAGWFSNRETSVRNDEQYDFSVNGENQETHESVSLENPYIRKIGVYKLLANHPNRGVYTGSIEDPGWYITDSLHAGELTITRCDNINHIYSGTFFFSARDANTGRTVNVTDGRFDVKE